MEGGSGRACRAESRSGHILYGESRVHTQHEKNQHRLRPHLSVELHRSASSRRLRSCAAILAACKGALWIGTWHMAQGSPERTAVEDHRWCPLCGAALARSCKGAGIGGIKEPISSWPRGWLGDGEGPQLANICAEPRLLAWRGEIIFPSSRASPTHGVAPAGFWFSPASAPICFVASRRRLGRGLSNSCVRRVRISAHTARSTR